MWHFLRLYDVFEQYSARTLDRFDKLILEALKRDGRISNVQLSALVNLSESACLRRVRALEDDGFIDRYAALLSQIKVGLSGIFLFTSVCTAKNKVSSTHSKQPSGTFPKSWNAT